MTSPRAFFCSTVGRKVVMAVTGVVMFGFVFAHMLENLLLYAGPRALNGWAAALHETGLGLWVPRSVLIACVLLHIWAAVSLTYSNVTARPQGYDRSRSLAASFASRTMIVTGPLLAVFIVYHLMHFTIGNVHPSFVAGDVYNNVVRGFQVPWVSGFYIVAMLALGLHLHHGVYSMLQSVGANHPRINAYRRTFAALFTAIVVAGFISFPVAVLLGVVREQPPINDPL